MSITNPDVNGGEAAVSGPIVEKVYTIFNNGNVPLQLGDEKAAAAGSDGDARHQRIYHYSAIAHRGAAKRINAIYQKYQFRPTPFDSAPGTIEARHGKVSVFSNDSTKSRSATR